MEKLMTLRDVCEYLQIHYMTAIRWCKDGKMPVFKVGGRYRTKKELLDKWMDEKTKGETNEKASS